MIQANFALVENAVPSNWTRLGAAHKLHHYNTTERSKQWFGFNGSDREAVLRPLGGWHAP